MKYDAFDRQSRWVFPSKATPGAADQSDYEEYRYDAAGNRTSLRKRDGQVIGYGYDALGRMDLKVAAAPIGTIRYAYDNRGLQLSAWFPANSQGVDHAYDGFGRLISTTSSMGGVSRAVSHLFDRDGRRAELAFPDGQRIWFERDGLGRMTKARRGAWGTSGAVTAAFGYNARGLPASFARGPGSATAYSYDGVSRLASIGDTFVGGAGNNISAFAYNPAGQLRRDERGNDAYAWTGSVAVSRNYSVNGLNQYTAAGPATFTYDANGNLTSDGTTSFTYDAENRLLTASGAKTAALAYDPLGRLWQVAGAGGAVTRFLYDGDELVAEYNAAGTLLRRYVHGDSDDDPLFWYEGPDLSQPRYPHADRQGSVVAIAGSDGGLLGINSYDEYGIPGASNQGRFQYTGQAWIPELGMYYYKARIYSPTLGRFLQVDPIGYDDQINLYAYVRNDPANKTDPSGEHCSKADRTDCPNSAATAATAATTVAAREGVGAGRARAEYKRNTSKLAPNDQAGRTAVKRASRAATPPITRGVVEAVRPGLGPKQGSGGTANRSNAAMDKLGRQLGTAGRVAGVAGVAVGVGRVATSENPGREAARVGGGMAGALAGAQAGASVGSLAGPWGAAAGGIIGGIAGGFLGEAAIDRALDW